MTPDQVLVDNPAAPDASVTTKPVRRRATKKTEDAAASAPAEQPALPEMPSEEARVPEKPKRVRTRVVKAKDSPTAAASTESASSDSTPSSVEAPQSKKAPQLAEAPLVSATQIEVAPTQSETSTSNEIAVRPSVPARFPSRFKRASQPQNRSHANTK